jgi:hypothetical protein
MLLLFSLIPLAQAMRCGNSLVDVGDSSFDVLSKCGEPLDKQTYEQSTPLYDEVGYQIGVSTTVVDKWIYQKSPAEFQYELIFDSGVLKQINTNRNP